MAGRSTTVELSGVQLLTLRHLFLKNRQSQDLNTKEYLKNRARFSKYPSQNTLYISVYCHCLLERLTGVWEIGCEKDVLFQNNFNPIIFPMPPLPEPWKRRYTICCKKKVCMYINTHMIGGMLELGRANKESIFKTFKHGKSRNNKPRVLSAIYSSISAKMFILPTTIIFINLPSSITFLRPSKLSFSFKATDWRSPVSSILPISF